MKKVKEVKKEVVEIKEDRSAFNCPDCKGEGLLDLNHVCPKCLGKGKI